MDQDGFIPVKSRKKKRSRIILDSRGTVARLLTGEDSVPELDLDSFIRKFTEDQKEFRRSQFFHRFLVTLEDHLTAVRGPDWTGRAQFQQLVCIGIGSFVRSPEARLQLIFLNILTETLSVAKADTTVYDPVLSSAERKILNALGFRCDEHNLEGSHSTSGKETLFFFPHCPKQLTNNLLWENWFPENLGLLHFLGNSFDRLITNFNLSYLKKTGADFIVRSHDYALETPVENCYKFRDVFNDLSLHSFSALKLASAGQEFWVREVPFYAADDLEFIRREEDIPHQ